MASTRMRLSTSVQVYHRVAAANDMGAHDIGTNDPAVSGLGGSGDFESIALHGMGAGSDALSEINIDSSSGDIYVEVVYGVN